MGRFITLLPTDCHIIRRRKLVDVLVEGRRILWLSRFPDRDFVSWKLAVLTWSKGQVTSRKRSEMEMKRSSGDDPRVLIPSIRTIFGVDKCVI